MKSSLRLGVGLSVLALFGSFCVGGVASANENRTAPLGSTACAQFTSQSVNWPTATGIATFTTGAICYVELTTTDGILTWIVPTDVYKIDTLAAGGGGGGGGATGFSGGGGGGGGGVGEEAYTVTPGESVTATIGVGGTAGEAGRGLDQTINLTPVSTRNTGTPGGAGGKTVITVGGGHYTEFGGAGGTAGWNTTNWGSTDITGGASGSTIPGGQATFFTYNGTRAGIPHASIAKPLYTSHIGNGGGPGGGGATLTTGDGGDPYRSATPHSHGGYGGSGFSAFASLTNTLIFGAGGGGGSGWNPEDTGSTALYVYGHGGSTTNDDSRGGTAGTGNTAPSPKANSGAGGGGGGAGNAGYTPVMNAAAGANGIAIIAFPLPTSTTTAPLSRARSAGSHIATTPTGTGWWIVHQDGGVFSYGTAATKFAGSLPGLGVHVSNITGIAASCTGDGYWMVGSDGGVFAFGGATFYGSLPLDHVTPNQPIVGIEPTTNCEGYYLVASDGGIFAFGNAKFDGSLPFDHVSASNIVGMAVVQGGYYEVGSDGGVFGFGAASFDGSLPADGLSVKDVIGIASSDTNDGYYLVSSDGGVFAFGTVTFAGSQAGETLTSTPVGLVVPPVTHCAGDVGHACGSAPHAEQRIVYEVVNATGVGTDFR